MSHPSQLSQAAPAPNDDVSPPATPNTPRRPPRSNLRVSVYHKPELHSPEFPAFDTPMKRSYDADESAPSFARDSMSSASINSPLTPMTPSTPSTPTMGTLPRPASAHIRGRNARARRKPVPSVYIDNNGAPIDFSAASTPVLISKSLPTTDPRDAYAMDHTAHFAHPASPSPSLSHLIQSEQDIPDRKYATSRVHRDSFRRPPVPGRPDSGRGSISSILSLGQGTPTSSTGARARSQTMDGERRDSLSLSDGGYLQKQQFVLQVALPPMLDPPPPCIPSGCGPSSNFANESAYTLESMMHEAPSSCISACASSSTPILPQYLSHGNGSRTSLNGPPHYTTRRSRTQTELSVCSGASTPRSGPRSSRPRSFTWFSTTTNASNADSHPANRLPNSRSTHEKKRPQEPATVARGLWRWGFLFPPLWAAGMVIMHTPLSAARTRPNSSKFASRRALLPSVDNHVVQSERRYARRCLISFLVFAALVAVIIVLVVVYT